MPGFFDVMKQPPVKFGSGEPYPLFTRLSLETTSFCNRSCSFCPIAWSDRGVTHMTDQLFEKIVGELRELEYDGVTQMFLLNEPTIDKTMLDKLRAVRAACPRTTTYASTNADTFWAVWKRDGLDAAVAKVVEYFDAGLTVLNVNVYDPGPEQHAAYSELVKRLIDDGHAEWTDNRYRKHNVRRRFVALTDMRVEERTEIKATDLLYIRNKHERAQMGTVPQKHCSRPQRHIVVLYNGKVPICCAIDPTDDDLPIMGDVNTQSLVEVWNGEGMNRYRYFTQSARRVLPGCSTCTHKMAYPHVVRKVSADPRLIERWEREAAH